MPDKVSRTPYFWLAAALYLDYILVGTSQIAVAQHMDIFMARLELDAAIFSGIIAATSIGRAVGGVFSGFLSDRFGRKPLVIAGTLGLFVSFTGMVCATNANALFAFVFCGGLASNLIDSGTFAALSEAFPKSAASALVGTKLGISIGQILFPCLGAMLLNMEIPRELSLGVVAVVAAANLIVLIKLKFPPFVPAKGFFKASGTPAETAHMRCRPTFLLDALPLLAFAGLSYVSFGIVMLWMPPSAES